jgi:hypothetical protein
MKTFEVLAIASNELAETRELAIDELEVVCGAAPSSSLPGSTYSGGADGYGGSRRNP